MNAEIVAKRALLCRTVLAFVLIALAAAVRIAPHPWNFTPIGAMALFSGAVLKDGRLAFAFPLLALFAGDLFTGLYQFQLMLVVYASFAVNVSIGFWLRDRRTIARTGGVVLAGAVQFFLVTNFAVWFFSRTYEHNLPGLVMCYLGGIPFFWNTLAGDTVYATLLFGGFALAERLFPLLRAELVREPAS